MKTSVIVLTLLLAFTGLCRAQGNLQFNQVLLLAAGGGQQTVPTGKIWKLTAGSSQGQSLNSARPFYLLINDLQNHFVFRSQDGNNQPTTSSNTTFPFWVPGGTTVEVPAVSAGGFRSVSVIEFNIVP